MSRNRRNILMKSRSSGLGYIKDMAKERSTKSGFIKILLPFITSLLSTVLGLPPTTIDSLLSALLMIWGGYDVARKEPETIEGK